MNRADQLKDRAIVAAEYRLHCSPHEWTDDDSEAMARYIIALHGPATSRMHTVSAQPSGELREPIVDERAVAIARRHHISYEAHPTLYNAAYEAARAAFTLAPSAIDRREVVEGCARVAESHAAPAGVPQVDYDQACADIAAAIRKLALAPEEGGE